MNYAKLFAEVQQKLAPCFEADGSLRDAQIRLDVERNRLVIHERDKEKVVFGWIVGDSYIDRVEVRTADGDVRVRRLTTLTAERLATALLEAANDGQEYTKERRAKKAEAKRIVALAQSVLTKAGVPNASNFEQDDSGPTGVPRVYVEHEGVRPGQVRLLMGSLQICCWPESAAEAVRPLLTLMEAHKAFDQAMARFAKEPQPSGDAS